MSERVTHLHIPVPAITRGTLARTHELKKERQLKDVQLLVLEKKLTVKLQSGISQSGLHLVGKIHQFIDYYGCFKWSNCSLLYYSCCWILQQ